MQPRRPTRRAPLQTGTVPPRGPAADVTTDRYRAALRRLAGGVAHRLNNNLTVALGLSELLIDELAPGSASAQDLTDIRAALLRSVGLVEEMLAFAQCQPLRLADLDLNDVVDRTVAQLRPTLPDVVDLQWTPSVPLRLVRADAAQLQQVVARLIVNASDALDGGGIVALATCDLSVSTESGSAVPGLAPGAWVQLTVRDTGRGLDAASVERAFEPFFGRELFGPRQGLGLAVDHGIVCQHGGWIGLESAPGNGTVVQVCLPAAASVTGHPE